MVEELYKKYADYAHTVVCTDEFRKFKSNPKYTYMLEHVCLEQGNKYLDHIRKQTNITDDDIRAFSASNDAVGKPTQEIFTCGHLSPSNLRYLFHAYLILTHIKELGDLSPRIVEVGGGYGGLCLAINFLCSRFGVMPKSYTLVDLEPASKLQARFLGEFSLSYPVEFFTSNAYGKDIPHEGMFLISNYCFSEISIYHQLGYRLGLFPKVVHGFMAWNFIPIYNFGFQTRIEEEYPATGNANKYVWF